jgi:Ca2+-binding EF-hand superfamily protein
MKRRTLSVVTATLFASLFAGLAFTASAGEGRHGKIKAADTNGDGVISREEAKALPRLAQHFDQIDADKNGSISMDEMKAMHARHREGRFDRMDTDRDGKVSRAEAERFPQMADKFGKLDANGDGFITKDELKSAHGKHKHGA